MLKKHLVRLAEIIHADTVAKTSASRAAKAVPAAVLALIRVKLRFFNKALCRFGALELKQALVCEISHFPLGRNVKIARINVTV